jgi:hypothetical protein
MPIEPFERCRAMALRLACALTVFRNLPLWKTLLVVPSERFCVSPNNFFSLTKKKKKKKKKIETQEKIVELSQRQQQQQQQHISSIWHFS